MTEVDVADDGEDIALLRGVARARTVHDRDRLYDGAAVNVKWLGVLLALLCGGAAVERIVYVRAVGGGDGDLSVVAVGGGAGRDDRRVKLESQGELPVCVDALKREDPGVGHAARAGGRRGVGDGDAGLGRDGGDGRGHGGVGPVVVLGQTVDLNKVGVVPREGDGVLRLAGLCGRVLCAVRLLAVRGGAVVRELVRPGDCRGRNAVILDAPAVVVDCAAVIIHRAAVIVDGTLVVEHDAAVIENNAAVVEHCAVVVENYIPVVIERFAGVVDERVFNGERLLLRVGLRRGLCVVRVSARRKQTHQQHRRQRESEQSFLHRIYPLSYCVI